MKGQSNLSRGGVNFGYIYNQARAQDLNVNH